MSQVRSNKRQRDMAKRDKAAAKSARREERKNSPDEAAAPAPIDQESVLAELAALHARYDAGDVEFEEFLDTKQELTERLGTL